MKKLSFLILGVSLAFATQAQQPKADTVALMICDRMAAVIGDLNSCSFSLERNMDVEEPGLGIVTRSGNDKVFMVGPDKMLIHSYGYKGHRGFWYNGTQFTFYSFEENNYASVPAPSNIMSTIDTIHKLYGLEFPAADFFYPTFTDDLIAQFDTIAYLGKEDIRGQECFHIIAVSKTMNAQFWIANDAFNLPVRFILIYKNEGDRQYEATFSDWALNPEVPVSVFEFMPPPMANQVTLMPRTVK
jgi:hypothetical protein